VPFQFKANFGNTIVAVDAGTFEYNLRATFRQPLGRRLRFDAGLDLEGNRWYLSADAPMRGMPREGDSGMGFGGAFVFDKLTLDQIAFAPYVALNFTPIKNLLITPQFRLDVYSFHGYQTTPDAFDKSYVVPEPRLSARYQINKWAAVKAALGAYHQPPDPGVFLKQFGNPAALPQSGWHYVAGVEFQPLPSL